MRIKKLLVLSKEQLAEPVAQVLARQGCELSVVENTARLLEAAPRADLVLLDADGSDTAPLTLLPALQARAPHGLAAVLTGDAATPNTKALLEQGAFEVLAKPLSAEALELLLLKAARLRLLAGLNEHYCARLAGQADEMIGRSDKIRAVFNALDKALSAAPCLLLTGETGTGKNLLARQLHRRAQAFPGPFIHLDCAAYPGPLLDKQLFGLSAADPNSGARAGCLEMAEGGTLVLNGIDGLPREAQDKLLKVLEDLAAHKMRLFCLSRRGLEPLVRDGLFSAALCAKLSANALHLPPLRERAGDAVMLAEYFLRRFAQDLGRPKLALDAALRETLETSQWPGNIRELRSWLESVVFSGVRNAQALSPVSNARAVSEAAALAALQPVSAPPPAAAVLVKPDEIIFKVGQPLQDAEKLLIQKTVEAMHGNRTKAAQVLGISVRTLYTKLLEMEHAQKNEQSRAEAAGRAQETPQPLAGI